MSGGYSLLQCAGFSLRWFLLLQSTGSRRAGFSSCGLRALERRLSSCGAGAYLLNTWDLPGPGLKPVSPALAGGLLTIAPPGMPGTLLYVCKFLSYIAWKKTAGFLCLLLHLICCNTFFFWLNYMESLAPHRYVVLKGRTIISSFFTQLHIFSFDTTPKFIKRCSPFFLQAYLGMQVELPAIGLGGWWWVVSTMRRAELSTIYWPSLTLKAESPQTD